MNNNYSLRLESIRAYSFPRKRNGGSRRCFVMSRRKKGNKRNITCAETPISFISLISAGPQKITGKLRLLRTFVSKEKKANGWVLKKRM